MMRNMNMKQSNQKKKKIIRKRGALPFYLRAQLSDHMLREYPQYKHIFKRCPNCGKNSLKPVGLNKMTKITDVLDVNERKCTDKKCNYVHVKDLVFYADPTNNFQYGLNVDEAVKKGRILE